MILAGEFNRTWNAIVEQLLVLLTPVTTYVEPFLEGCQRLWAKQIGPLVRVACNVFIYSVCRGILPGGTFR